MEDKKFYWLKLKKDFFKRHDIRIIEGMPNGTNYIVLYMKLLCESIDHQGRLRFSDKIPYTPEMLSTITNTSVDIVKEAIEIFCELNLMQVDEDKTYIMCELEKMLGCETAWAEKKRKQRELPKLTNGSVRLNAEMMKLPNGETRYVDEKRYGGNGMLVLDRAMGKCEICGSDEKVVIHHNNGYSNEPEDLICLCAKCHGLVHSSKWGGQFPPSVHLLSDKSKSIDIEKEIDKDNNIICSQLNESVFKLPLNDNSYYSITQDMITHYEELYPNVNVMQELRNILGWLESNPTKRKTRLGIARFVNNWLAKEQDKGNNPNDNKRVIKNKTNDFTEEYINNLENNIKRL